MTHLNVFIVAICLKAAPYLQVWTELVWVSVVPLFPASMLLLFIISLLALQSRAGLHMSQILQRRHHAGMPRRLWAVHRLQAARPGCDSKVYGTQSWQPNPMAAIKPFIFYVLVSRLSDCWGKRDAGPTSQKPQRNYSIWIIHHTWGRYLFKGADMSLLPSYIVKWKAV